MTYIKVDLRKSNNYITQLRKKKKDYCDDMNSVYELLNNVDGCWNDNASLEFKDIIRSDRIKIFDYFEAVDKLYNGLEKFNDELILILSAYGYSSKSKLLLKFDNDRLNVCLDKLSNAVYYLNSAIYVINNKLPSDSELINVKYQLEKVINIIYQIKSNIEKFNKSVLNSISLHTAVIKKVEGLELNIIENEYIGNLIDISQK